ncbi:MAG: C25 family cysteine peptidase [Bacteroidales bacterium]|nr:C25 family cysteine peptidase [Bacteroidales bacterium]
MKRYPYFLLLLLLTGLHAFAKVQLTDIRYPENAGSQGLKIVQSNNNGLTLDFSLSGFSLNSILVEGETMQTVLMPEAFLPNNEGYPNLPGISKMIAVPKGAEVILKINGIRTETYTNIAVAPAARIPKDNEPDMPEPVKNALVYNTNALYPSNPVKLSEPMTVRGMDVVMLGITPFQYNPVTKELIAYKDIDISIEFRGVNGQFGETRLRNRWWDPILQDMILNQNVIPSVDYSVVNSRSEDSDFEYLIISPDDPVFLQWADSIRLFRIRQGIRTGIVTTMQIGGNTVSAIKNYVNNAYNTWDIPPAAVLLLGDFGSSGSSIISPIYDNYCASDNIFADVSGNHLPDIVFARMTAQNPAHLETYITKFLKYERTPPVNPSFYDNPITAMGWQTERWFQLCSEIVNGFFEFEKGKSPVRENAIYSGSPSGGVWSTAQNTQTIINYFGESGLQYVPNTPNHLTDWGGNATRINNDINSGAFLLQHRDHGMETGWGEPDYNNSNIGGTTNTDLTFVFSINCLTGKYNLSGECFTEAFHRHEFGALGLTAASEVSYSFVNDAYVWGLYDNMWPEFMPAYGTTPESRGMLPAFGNAAGKYFLAQSSWPYNTNNKTVTYHLFHHHGDAFSTLYSEVPQNMVIEHEEVILSGLGFFTVNAPQGSLICLSLDDEILAVADGNGQAQNITLPNIAPGSTVNLTITKPNFYRYERTLGVIPPDGPYCIFNSFTINDEMGNNNSHAEYNELVYLNVAIKNLGLETGNNINVSLSSTDANISIVQAETIYDEIEADSVKTVDKGFLIRFNDNYPNQHQAKIFVYSTNGEHEWNSYFFVSARSPNIKIGQLVVDDSENGNNNGRLDPGETAIVNVQVYNNGYSPAFHSTATLKFLSQYISQSSELYYIGDIWMPESIYPAFEVEVSPNAPIGLMTEISFHVESGGYNVSKSFFPKIGLYREDWESGNFNSFNWQHFGSVPWEISTSNPYQGLYHARSGEIADGQSSLLKLTYKTLMNDSIIFQRKVSSEAEADKLRFFIDNNQVASWSGISQEWRREAFYVPAGNHTFQWMYEKNGSGSDGTDCGWLDNIYLPSPLVSTVFAGNDATVCSNGVFYCNPRATNVKTLEWTTSGDGVFNNPTAMYAGYTPGANDLQFGSVSLTLNIVDQSNQTFDDSMILAFTTAPDQATEPSGPAIIDPWIENYSWYSTSHVEGATMYSWEIEPSTAGIIIGFDTSAIVLWDNSYAGNALIKVAALNSCGQSDWSTAFEVMVDNDVSVNSLLVDNMLTVYPNPVNNSLNVSLHSDKPEQYVISITSQTGSCVYKAVGTTNLGRTDLKIDLSKESQGVYLLNFESPSKKTVQKLILMK